MSDATEMDLEAIRAHARGGLPPGDGEHYVEVLVAEVERLREKVELEEAAATAMAGIRENLRDLEALVDHEDSEVEVECPSCGTLVYADVTKN